jgi:cellulose 1,4-beta-cellobiosidase
MTYTGTLSGNPPALGSTPAGFNCSFDTSTAGQVKLVVASPAPAAPANITATATNLLINLKWNSANGANFYNLKRGTVSGIYPTLFSGLIATNYSDANVTNAVNYFYVVTAVGTGGESTNSLQASAVPLPSNQPTNITTQIAFGQLQLSWPQDHLGWRLQIQTNDLSGGLGTNWVTVPNSTNVMQTNIVINPANGSVFLRMIYP